MNLLDEAWLPVRLHGGGREWVAPHQLSDPRLAGFDADRADFNGALAQFAIGLLQTCSPVDSASAWRRTFEQPPDADTLRAWFAPHAAAFVFDGDGARFMQDFELRAGDAEPSDIGALLIEAPGENTVKNNGDHFVKRGRIQRLCPHCAALSLFTLQLNAPAGGAGHRTGLRGGGPLTTLLVADGAGGDRRSLWHTLWLNVQPRSVFADDEDDGDAVGSQARHLIFPWWAPIGAIQPDDGETAPAQTHPLHVFWAMPRRMRLDFDAVVPGRCSLCGRDSPTLLAQYVTRNQGLNYKGPWRHPLSPYYQAKEGLLPLHPQPGGLGYRHWLGWVLGQRSDKRVVERAAVIEQFFKLGLAHKMGLSLRLWAFGFDMDNMKARCWYDATMPLYALEDCGLEVQTELRDEVGSWLAAAELAAACVRGAVKDAWFGAEGRGDLSFIDAAFWSRTEPAFYRLLSERIAAAREGRVGDRLASATTWQTEIRAAALRLFDRELVGSAAIERQNPARVAQAHQKLRASLDGPKLRAALGLPAKSKPESKPEPKSTKASARPAAAPKT